MSQTNKHDASLSTTVLLVLLGVASVCLPLDAYPGGAPTSSCILRMPKHGKNQRKTTPSPFDIQLSQKVYNPLDEIIVTIKSNVKTATFRGFVLVARRKNETADTEELVGTFVQYPTAEARGRFWYPMSGKASDINCLTHSGKSDKSSIVVTWRAPKQSVGDVAFSLSIVEKFSDFWLNIQSDTLQATQPSVDKPFPGVIKVDGPEATDFQGCGKEYGCVMSPAFCQAPYHLNCDLVVAFQPNQAKNGMEFKMAAIAPTYLSLSFSHDKKMGDDLTITCTMTKDKTFLSLQNGYNPGFFNERHRMVNYSDIRINRINEERLFCQFSRPLQSEFTRAQDRGGLNSIEKKFSWPLDLDKEWYIFVATGDSYAGTDVVGKHKELPAITSRKVGLQEKSIVYANRVSTTVRTHATLMLLAWMVLVSIGMVTASYCKQVLDKEYVGVKLWFHVHRTSVCLAYLSAAVAVVLMFVDLNRWTKYAHNHAVLGMVAMGAATLQIFVAMFRPAPSHKHRTIFRWFHRILGPTTHGVAAAAMINTYWIAVLPSQLKTKLLIILCSWLVFSFLWQVITSVVLHRQSKADTTNPMVIKMVTENESMSFESLGAGNDSANNSSKLIKIVYGSYVLAMVVFFAVATYFTNMY